MIDDEDLGPRFGDIGAPVALDIGPGKGGDGLDGQAGGPISIAVHSVSKVLSMVCCAPGASPGCGGRGTPCVDRAPASF